MASKTRKALQRAEAVSRWFSNLDRALARLVDPEDEPNPDDTALQATDEAAKGPQAKGTTPRAPPPTPASPVTLSTAPVSSASEPSSSSAHSETSEVHSEVSDLPSEAESTASGAHSHREASAVSSTAASTGPAHDAAAAEAGIVASVASAVRGPRSAAGVPESSGAAETALDGMHGNAANGENSGDGGRGAGQLHSGERRTDFSEAAKWVGQHLPYLDSLEPDYKSLLTDFYQHHNPPKASVVDEALSQFGGREALLLERLHEKYRVPYSPIKAFITGAGADAGAGTAAGAGSSGGGGSGVASESLLRLYGLYKRATVGMAKDSPKPPPGASLCARAKFASWELADTLDQDEAMRDYVRLATSSLGWASPNPSPSVSPGVSPDNTSESQTRGQGPGLTPTQGSTSSPSVSPSLEALDAVSRTLALSLATPPPSPPEKAFGPESQGQHRETAVPQQAEVRDQPRSTGVGARVKSLMNRFENPVAPEQPPKPLGKPSRFYGEENQCATATSDGNGTLNGHRSSTETSSIPTTPELDLSPSEQQKQQQRDQGQGQQQQEAARTSSRSPGRSQFYSARGTRGERRHSEYGHSEQLCPAEGGNEAARATHRSLMSLGAPLGSLGESLGAVGEDRSLSPARSAASSAAAAAAKAGASPGSGAGASAGLAPPDMGRAASLDTSQLETPRKGAQGRHGQVPDAGAAMSETFGRYPRRQAPGSQGGPQRRGLNGVRGWTGYRMRADPFVEGLERVTHSSAAGDLMLGSCSAGSMSRSSSGTLVSSATAFRAIKKNASHERLEAVAQRLKQGSERGPEQRETTAMLDDLDLDESHAPSTLPRVESWDLGPSVTQVRRGLAPDTIEPDSPSFRPRASSEELVSTGSFGLGLSPLEPALEEKQESWQLTEAPVDVVREYHSFKLMTFKKPTWCGFCGVLIVGVYQQGHSCESCGLTVHSHCQRKAEETYVCSPVVAAQIAAETGGAGKAALQAVSTVSTSRVLPSAMRGWNALRRTMNRAVGRAPRPEDVEEEKNAAAQANQENDAESAVGGGGGGSGGGGGPNGSNGSSSADKGEDGVRSQTLSADLDGCGGNSGSLPQQGPPIVGRLQVDVILAHRCCAQCSFNGYVPAAPARIAGMASSDSAFLGPTHRHRKRPRTRGTLLTGGLGPGDVGAAAAESDASTGARGRGRSRTSSRPVGDGRLGDLGTAEVAASGTSEASPISLPPTPHDGALTSGLNGSGTTSGDEDNDWYHVQETVKGGRDYYIRVHVGDKSQRTRTVYETEWPRFNNRFQLHVPHWQAKITVALVDAMNDKIVGAVELPALKLHQREQDALAEGWKQDLDVAFDLPLRLDSGSAGSTALDSSTVDTIVGFVRVRARFQEVDELWKRLNPTRAVPSPPTEEFSVETFMRHVDRAKQVISWWDKGLKAYCDLVGWKDPLLSLFVFVVFVYLSLYMDAEYLIAVPAFLLVAHLTYTLVRRRTGAFVSYWLEEASSTAGKLVTDVTSGDGAKDGGGDGAGEEGGGGGGATGQVAEGGGEKDAGDLSAGAGLYPGDGSALSHSTTDAGQPSAVAAAAAAAAAGFDPAVSREAQDSFQPIAMVKIAVIRGRGLGARQEGRKRSAPGRSYVRVSYVPQGYQPRDPEPDLDLSIGSTSSSNVSSEPVWTSSLQEDYEGRSSAPSAVVPKVSQLRSGPGRALRPPSGSQLPALLQPLSDWAVKGLWSPLVEALVPSSSYGHLGDASRVVHSTTRMWPRPRRHLTLSAGERGRGGDPGRREHGVSGTRGRLSDLREDDDDDEDRQEREREREESGEAGQSDPAFFYHILQPRAGRGQPGPFLPWGASRGVLRFLVFVEDPVGAVVDDGLVDDVCVGEVVIPVKDLVFDDLQGGAQPESQRWHQLHTPPDFEPDDSDQEREAASPDGEAEGGEGEESSGAAGSANSRSGSGSGNSSMAGTSAASAVSAAMKAMRFPVSLGGVGAGDDDDKESGGGVELVVPALELRLQLVLPDPDEPITEEVREASKAVAAATARAARLHTNISLLPASTLTEDQGGSGPVSTLNWALGLRESTLSTGAFVQNGLGDVLDMIETVKNMLNWTHPAKTLRIYCLAIVVWLIFFFVRGRIIVLAVGLFEFLKCFIPNFNKSPSGPTANILDNLMATVPNDEDLRKAYMNEARMVWARRDAVKRRQRRRARLRALFSCQWEGSVRVRTGASRNWTNAFVVLQGHRVLWWRSEDQLEQGRPADAQLLLQGHAGITAPSPQDVRDMSHMGGDAKLVAVFGRSVSGSGTQGTQERWVFVTATREEKAAFTEAITSALTVKAD